MAQECVFKRMKGFADIYGENAATFTFMEETARNVFSRYCYEELRTPILESTSLFLRSIGTETDVVQKEMFTFADSKGRSMTLRPEATAGVMRACIEEGLASQDTVTRLFTIGPMFRHERPQKGRMRQFHQINCECLGTDSPYADAEIILMLLDFLKSLKLSALKLKINSLGCRTCRPKYMEILKEYLSSLNSEELCEDCQRRRISNPLRVLDCKNSRCIELIADAPGLQEHSCENCRSHMDTVLNLLKESGVEPEIDNRLVRGLDYYLRTTFEVVSDQIGSQTAVAGGGRYDGLISQLGGEDVPGVGFACGMERLALLLGPTKKPVPDFYMLGMDVSLHEKAFLLTRTLREQGLSGEMNYKMGTFKNLMRKAAKSGAKYCLILGPDEALSDEITVKNMENGNQERIPQASLAQKLKNLIK